MSIRITRNQEGNCITFVGSSNPAYWNSCLSAQLNQTTSDRVDIINDLRSANQAETQYEFYAVSYLEFADKDGNAFATAQDMVDYVNVNANVSAPADINIGYKGVFDASTNLPPTDASPVNGDWYYVGTGGVIDTVTYNLNDIIKYSETLTAWERIENKNATVQELEDSALDQYDIHVDGTYTGTVRNGSSIHPYNDLAVAIAASVEGDAILIKGSINALNSSTAPFILPHGLHFYGVDQCEVKFTTYDSTNGDLFYYAGADNTQEFSFKNIIIKNAGGYALHIEKTLKVEVEDCTFINNGWNGLGLDTVLASATSGLLGYDSTNTDLQAFYAGTNTSDGGAMRLEEITQLLIIGNTITKNLRGLRVQDCGVGGGGVITRNQSTLNIDSGIYLAAGVTYGGCQSITVSMNVTAYNANNGLLTIGGINNKFSQNEVNGNWNAGFCAWGAANVTLRDCGLYDNNRSQYNGIGNTGDAKASIQINEAYNLLGTQITVNPAFRFIAEILDTQVHYTGLGSNIEKIGFLITSDVGALADNSKNIIKIDDVGFIGQDYAVDLSEVDVSNLRLSLGDNSFQSLTYKAVKAPLAGNYNELPFSNHVMEVPEVDVKVDTLKHMITLTEGVGGNTINTYQTNELTSVVHNGRIDIIQSNTDKIQLRDCSLGNVYINGVVAGSNINTLNDSLNAAFNMDLTEYKEFLESEVGVEGEGDFATFYYIESPDTEFHYPLFKTADEANAFDLENGGTGTSHTHTYADDLSNTTWYMPDTLGVMSGSSAPVNGVYGTSTNVIWNIQTTSEDANYLPTFNNITYNVQEGSAINIQYKPAGMTDTFNITNVPAGYANDGFAIIGTAEDITNGYGQSVTHVINVTKANAFGSVQGTITINVKANLTGNEFTIVDQGGAIKFTQDGGITVLDFNTVTFNAGSTYKFFVDGTTMQTNDVFDVVDANGNTITSNDGLTQSGSGPGYAGTYFQYTIPTDVAPGKFLKFIDGATGTTYANVPMILAGSTYTTSVAGVTNEGPSANFTGTVTNVNSAGWLSIDDTLAAGQRIVFDSAFITDLHDSMPDYSMVFVGLKDDNWTNTTSPNGSYKGGASIRFMKIQGDVGVTGLFVIAYANGANTSQFYVEDLTNTQAFIEVTSDGNNIRLGVIDSSSYNATTDTYDNWDSGKRVETGDQGYGITTIDPMIYWGAANTGGGVNTVGWDYSETDWTGLTEVSVPTTAPTRQTDWTKALDFSGSNEHTKTVANYLQTSPLQMGGLANLVDLGTTSQGDTSNNTSSRPWATAVVFKSDGNNSNQMIWNQGEGSSSGNDNIYLRVSAAGSLFFGWGREGSGYNECRLANQNISTSNWYGVSVAHSGVRLGGGNASASNLADCFDIRLMSSADSFAAVGSNLSVTANWTSSGNRMDRTVAGDFTVGGRGSGKSFHGKIASMVVTTLLQGGYSSAQMPTGTMVNADQAKMMITDPVQWVDDYKVRLSSGNPNGLFRKSAERFATNYFTFAGAYQHTYVWLMGDGTSDSYSNGVRNYIYPSDQNYGKLQLNSMVSNDIENVSIPGLS
jgi:hypothetical protein